MHAAAEKILEGTGPSEKLRTTGQGRHRFICVASAQLETGRSETRSVVSGTAAGGLGGAATGIFYIEGSDVCTTACLCQYPLNRTFQIWHFRCLYITPRKRGFKNAQEAVEHSRTRLQPRTCRAPRVVKTSSQAPSVPYGGGETWPGRSPGGLRPGKGSQRRWRAGSPAAPLRPGHPGETHARCPRPCVGANTGQPACVKRRRRVWTV